MMDLKKKKKGKGTSLSRQIIALIVLGAVCLALVGTLITVNILTGIRKFEYGGETYYILRQKDDKGETCYIMTDKDRNPLEATKDGYFIVKDGTLIELDQKTGLADRYIPVDTEGNEQVGINDRVLIFPHTNKANVQSIEVYNGKGSFAFYRMRSYEDTDKVVYACILRSGEYYLVDTDGKEYTRGEDGLYTLKSGNKLAVDANTGIIYTHTYYDFDGKEYHIKKDSEGAYKLYDANGSEVTNRVSKTGELKDNDGKTYEAELYNYLVTAHGTLLKVDEKYGTLSIWSVQEYIEKSKSFDTYYFLYKGDKYVLCDSKGETIKYTAIDDANYYRTGGNAYIAFNEDNGSYSVRIKKNFYIIASNDGVYTLYNKKTPLGANGSGYFAIDEETYVSFDTASGSYSVLEFTGEGYEETDSKYLNATVNTDADGEFVIEGFEGTTYDPSLFTALIVSGGYTITAEGGKLSQPEKLYDANGNVMKNESGAEMIDFAAYGLIECERVDETGKTYTYKPAYYVLKDLEGNVHRLTIGDKIVSGAGYYIRYEQLGEDGKFIERQAVYILLDNYSTGYTQTYDIFYYYSISDTLLASVESIVTPLAVFPMSSNNYFDVEDFTFMVYNPQKSQDIILNDDPKDDDDYYDMLVRFSYEDVEERRNTAMSNFPYIMEEGCDLYGYTINSYSVDSCLMSLMDLKYVGVSHLGVDDQDLVKYGLDVAQYVIYFKHANMGYESQMLLISALTPNDTYYVYSQLYDMIVEVERSSLNFLSWKSVDWLTTDFYDIGIGFGDNVKIEAGDYWANFDIAMSQTLTTNIKSTGSSNFTHTVFASDDRKTHILSIGAKVNANITGSATVTNLISVDFETLRDYYTYITGNKSTAGMTTEEIEKLNAFVETIYQHAEDDGQAMTLHSMTLRDTAGMSHEVNVYFIFSPNGEITVSVSVNKEALTLVFSMDAYLAYEKVMFSDKTLTPAEKTKAFDFYLAPSVSATAQNAFEQVIGTNSEGTTTIFTNGQIVKKYKDGRVVVDYALSNEYKVFFDVGDGDLIGIGRTWIRYYDMDDPETSKGGYKEITDKTYSFNSSLVRLIMPLDDGGNKVIKEGTLGSGNFNVTVTEDMVKVVDAEGNETRYLRYSGTSPFSSLYSTFLWASYEGYCDIPDEQKEAFKESEDSACQMKLTIDTKMGTQYVFRTYQYSERRAYITANGEGDFFVMRSFIDKIINTSKVVFEGTNVDPTDKY